jgi:hypothetical protein
MDPAENLTDLRLGELFLLEEPRKALLDGLQTPLDQRILDIYQERLGPIGGKDLSDAATHRTRTDDGNFLG